MTNDEYSIFLRGKVVAICEAILQEEIGVIAGSRQLNSLGHQLCDDFDKDFRPFVAIDSETDHLPVDRERQNWSQEALERKDREISEYEIAAKEEAFEACKILIQRFIGFKNADL
jgi:hypothetical protein